MPGELPTDSAYTYASAFTVDEAEAVHATRVRFSAPVISYTEDFIGFPVGASVPSGSFDPATDRWAPEASGVVVEVLGETGGLARLDVTGAGAASSASALAALGITSAERHELAELYAPGTKLWRVALQHFTVMDYNGAYGIPDGAQAPPGGNSHGGAGPQPCSGPGCKDGPNDGDCQSSGSIIGCSNQTLGEDIPLADTPFSLVYNSERAPLRDRRFTIPLTSATPPPGIKRIDVTITVAGQRHFFSQDSAPADQSYTFVWDGKDLAGRQLQGAQPITATQSPADKRRAS